MSEFRSKRSAAAAAGAKISKVAEDELKFTKNERKIRKYEEDEDFDIEKLQSLADCSSDEEEEELADESLKWYAQFKKNVRRAKRRKEKKEEKERREMSEIERIRLKNIEERAKLFKDLNIASLVSGLSKEKLGGKEGIWKKLCNYCKKKEDFTESDIEQFLESMAVFESRGNIRKVSPHMRIGYVKDLAKIYHMNTGEDFFKDYPKMIDTLKELEAHWEAPTEDGWLGVGTTRSNGIQGAKNEKLKEKLTNALDDPKDSKRIWKEFCSFAHKKDSFDDEDFTDFLESIIDYDNFDKSIEKLIMYEIALMLQYVLEFEQDLSKDFPGVANFVKAKIRRRAHYIRFKPVYDDFCEFVGKSRFFREDDFLAYFKDLAQRCNSSNTFHGKVVEVRDCVSQFNKLDVQKRFPDLPYSGKMADAFWREHKGLPQARKKGQKKAPGVPRKNQFRKQKWLKKYNVKDCVVKLHDISKTLDVAMAEDDDDDDRMEMN